MIIRPSMFSPAFVRSDSPYFGNSKEALNHHIVESRNQGRQILNTEDYRKIYNDHYINIEDLPPPRTVYEQALFRKRIAVTYDMLDSENVFDDEIMKECKPITDEEKQYYCALDENLRDNRDYSNESIPFDDLAYPRTVAECSEYYQRLLTSPDSDFKDVMLTDIERFEEDLNEGHSFKDIYNYDCWTTMDDFLMYRYIALRIAYLKKEGYIS